MDFQDGKRMFGDIKSKLGFGSREQDRGYDDAYDGGYDGYDEYEDYGDDYGDYDEASSSSSSYDRYAPVTTRASRGRTASSEPSMPRLVSIDDVRANTPSASTQQRDYASARHASASATSRSFGRTMVDSSLPPQMTPEGTAAVSAAASRRRSEGLDSLFTPTTDAAPAEESSQQRGADVPVSREPASSGAHAAPAPAAPVVASSSYTPRRTLRVIKPVSYADVESVAKALKAEEVVILVFANTPENLMKRVLDFSFGAAAALDASVECLAEKVFAIARTSGVSEVERMTLRNQGVLS